MNIYQKKIVKEKEYIFNEDCVQTKSTNPNSKHDNESDINSKLNSRKYLGINSKPDQKIQKNENNNRLYRSKSLITDNKEKNKKYIPKAIKTVLIKFKKPLEQNNILNNINYKTYYSNKFYKPKEINLNNLKNEFTALEIEQSLLSKRHSLITNYNTNEFPFFIPYNDNKNNKLTRNKSVILKNNKYIIIDNENNNINKSFSTIYKKNYCLDKHKNFGGNFKNKKRSNTNYKTNINKSNYNIKYPKNLMLNNIYSLNIKNSFISNCNNNCKEKINENENPQKINKKENNNIQYNLSIIKDNKNNNMNMNDFIYQNENKKEIKTCRNKEGLSLKKNKLKKDIPHLNFQNYNHNISSIIKNMSQKKFYKYLNAYNNTNQTKNIKKNIITFEEPITDKYSMKKNINLVNLINISGQCTKRENLSNKKNDENNKVEKYLNKKDNNRPNIKIKKNNSKKKTNQKEKSKIKGKVFRTMSTKKIETENVSFNINNINKIKSIPLKLNNLITKERNDYNQSINISSIPNNKIIKNEINENVVIISKNDFRLWNDLTRIYDNIGKYQ